MPIVKDTQLRSVNVYCLFLLVKNRWLFCDCAQNLIENHYKKTIMAVVLVHQPFTKKESVDSGTHCCLLKKRQNKCSWLSILINLKVFNTFSSKSFVRSILLKLFIIISRLLQNQKRLPRKQKCGCFSFNVQIHLSVSPRPTDNLKVLFIYKLKLLDFKQNPNQSMRNTNHIRLLLCINFLV